MNFDVFMFFNEEDLLKIRLEEHDSFIDKFIILELNQTHSGKPKPQNFNHEKFLKFKDKIIYRFVDFNIINKYKDLVSYSLSGNIYQNKSHWERENFQRNYSKIILNEINAGDDDIILSSDLDEILDENSFRTCTLKINGEKCPIYHIPVAKVKQKHRYYKLNLLSDNFGYGPRVMKFNFYKISDPSILREYNAGFVACEGGWHFSYLSKDKNNVYKKIKSFSHAYQQDDILNEDQALQRVLNLVKYKEDINSSYPKEILNNRHVYSDYIA